MRRRWFDYALLLLFLGAPAPAAAQSFCGPFLSVPTSNFDGDVLFGVSYFGAIGIPEAQLTRLRDDLDFFKSRGFNNIRVWANWAVQDAQDSTILDANGNLIPDAVDRLKVILDEAADRDLTVDLTFSWRSFYEDLNGGHCSDPESCANGEPCFEDNWDDFVGGIADAADTLASPVYFDGVFFDLANEHNAGCSPVFKLNRDEVEELSAAVFAEDPQRILTVSAIEDGDWVDRYVDFLGGATVDFPTPHFDRDELWAIETGVNVENLRQDLLPERYPIHLQEERRYCLRQICGDECTDECEPADFLLALANAASYGAGGSNFHTRAGYELEEGTLRFYERLEHDHEQETLDCTLALSLDCLAEQLTASRCAPPPRLLDTFTGGPARPETNPPPTEYNLIDRVTEVGTGDWQVDGSDPGTQGWALKVIRDPGVVTFSLTQQQKSGSSGVRVGK